VGDRDRSLSEAGLLGFVRSDLLDGRPVPIDPDTYLFDDGMIDSLKILRLIAFIEERTGRRLEDHEIVMAHFRTVRAIVATFGGSP
jgi:acyl carrier protein